MREFLNSGTPEFPAFGPFAVPAFHVPNSSPKGPVMATVLSISGSPSATSRTARLLRHLDARLEAQGHDVHALDVRTLPAEALLGADFAHPAIVEATELLARADGVVVATPVYKAAYSGLLKALLDLLPQYGLDGKTVLPLATGGTTAHVLALDYALRPVLNSMGADHIVQGWFTLDKDITVAPDGTVGVAPGSAEALSRVVDQFSGALVRTARPLLAAAS
jgi:FMN reductase